MAEQTNEHLVHIKPITHSDSSEENEVSTAPMDNVIINCSTYFWHVLSISPEFKIKKQFENNVLNIF